MLNRRHVFWGFWGYLLFVVYGSLVPFEYRSHSIDEAVAKFSNIPYLALGIASRADWVANIVLYVPLSFLACLWLGGSGRIRAVHYFVLPVVLALMLVIAAAVEFMQIFFAPRTVSINDLISETLGSLGGIALWLFGRHWLLHLLQSFRQGGHQSIVAVLSAYGLFYLAQSLFPFDVVVSLDELSWKLSSDRYALLLAGDGSSTLRIFARLLGEVVAIVPLGVLVALAYPHLNLGGQGTFRRAFFIGAVLGGCLEFAQFFMASGVSQGLSVVVRGFGFTAGAMLGHNMQLSGVGLVAGIIRKITPYAVVPYLLVLAALAGWFSQNWLPFSQFFAELANIRLIPFYYHYFSTEAHSMASLLANMVMYMPVGLVVWAYVTGNRAAWIASLVAGGLALVVEFGMTLATFRHPDATNLLIAAVAAAVTYLFMCWLEGVLKEKGGMSVPQVEGSLSNLETRESEPEISTVTKAQLSGRKVMVRDLQYQKGLVWQRVFASLSLAGGAYYAFNYPLYLSLLLLGTVAYIFILARWPSAWLIVLPVCIPVFDLYTLSGRFFMTELDYLILLTVSIKYLSGQCVLPGFKTDRGFYFIIVGLMAAYLLSVGRVIIPIPDIDLNSFYSLYSPFNSLRVSKSLLWALFIYPILAYEVKQNTGWFLRFSQGMVGGLLALSLVVVVERALFSGLFNFSGGDYRVKGSFVTMHTGGGHIDAYLVMVLPFLLTLLLRRATMATVMLVGGLGLLALYTVFVTYSRGPYAVTGVIILMVVGGLGVSSRRANKKTLMAISLVISMSVGGAWLSLPFIYDTVLSERIELTEQDSNTRVSHWRNTIDLIDSGLTGLAFGNGPGTFSYRYYIENTLNNKPIAVHRLVQTNDSTALRLTAGNNIYTSQYIHLDVNKNYTLRFDARSPEGRSSLIIPICEKWIMDSFRCIWLSSKLSKGKDWSKYTLKVDTAKLRPSLGFTDQFLRRPTAISMALSRADGFVEIDNIELLGADGNNILKNGGFEQGKDRWYFDADDHLLWHSKNIVVNLLHDYGWVGLILILTLIGVVFVRLLNVLFSGSRYSIPVLASIVAFLSIGMTTSIFDVPQLSFLFFLIIFVGQQLWAECRISDVAG